MLPFFIATALPELPPINIAPPTKQQIILERIMQSNQAATDKKFGDCSYAWGQWKLSADGVRTTTRQCIDESVQDPVFISVSCSALKVNIFAKQQWEGWRNPMAKGAKKGEALMVAALCANALN